MNDVYVSWDFAPGKILPAIQSKGNGKKVANNVLSKPDPSVTTPFTYFKKTVYVKIAVRKVFILSHCILNST